MRQKILPQTSSTVVASSAGSSFRPRASFVGAIAKKVATKTKARTASKTGKLKTKSPGVKKASES